MVTNNRGRGRAGLQPRQHLLTTTVNASAPGTVLGDTGFTSGCEQHRQNQPTIAAAGSAKNIGPSRKDAARGSHTA